MILAMAEQAFNDYWTKPEAFSRQAHTWFHKDADQSKTFAWWFHEIFDDEMARSLIDYARRRVEEVTPLWLEI